MKSDVSPIVRSFTRDSEMAVLACGCSGLLSTLLVKGVQPLCAGVAFGPKARPLLFRPMHGTCPATSSPPCCGKLPDRGSGVVRTERAPLMCFWPA